MAKGLSVHISTENPYGDLVLAKIPQLLSSVDRNPYSPTYGCADRAFWHYRTMVDYAAPIHQEIALTLAIALDRDEPGNPYFQSAQIEAIVRALLDYWLGLQHRDGSFPEFYPGERSFVATAFTSFSISEALLRMGDRIEGDLRERLLNGLLKAAHWLGAHRDVVVVNHTAGAIAFLRNMVELTGERDVASMRDDKIDDLLAHQHSEGWYYEYGGADLAYLSLAVDYLAQDYRRSNDERLRSSLLRALDFMVCFVHPMGGYGGEYGSRNAKYLMPHGVELLAGESESAARLAQYCRRRLQRTEGVSPAHMDDRYTGFFLNKYAAAWSDSSALPDEVDDRLEWSGYRLFPGAGWLLHKSDNSLTVVSMSKHGVVNSWLKDGDHEHVFSDTGYFAAFENGSIGVTQWLDLAADSRCDVEGEERSVRVRGSMVRYNASLPMEKYLVPFRLFLGVFSRWGQFMDWFGQKVIKRMIVDQTPLPVDFEREVRLSAISVTVSDRLQLKGGAKVTRLGKMPCATSIHVASSRYWQDIELDAEGQWESDSSLLAQLNRGEIIEIEHHFSQDSFISQHGRKAAVGQEITAS